MAYQNTDPTAQGYSGTSDQEVGFLNKVDPGQVMGGMASPYLADMFDASNEFGGGMFNGFSFPANLGVHDFASIATWAENFAADTGYAYLPKPQEMMGLYDQVKAGKPLDKTKVYGEWAKKLPPELQWVKYGKYNRDSWSQYKMDNKERVAQRYGAQNVTDANFVNDLDNTTTTARASGGQVGQGKEVESPKGNVR